MSNIHPDELYEQLCENATSRKKKTLTLVHEVCRKQSESDVKDFSLGTIAGLMTDYSFDATVKCGFEHGFSIIVPKHANTTTDNEYMTGKQTYEYYNGFIWQGRYAHCISPEETIERMKR